MIKCSHLRSFRGSRVLLLLPLLLLLLQLLDALLQHVGPEVAFEVRQLVSAGQTVLRRLFEDVLRGREKRYLCILFSVSQRAVNIHVCLLIQSSVQAATYRIQPGHLSKILFIINVLEQS